MSIEIKFYGETAAEALADIAVFVAGLHATTSPVALTTAIDPKPPVQVQPEKAPKTRGGRKAADKPAPEVQLDAPEAEAQDAADEAEEVETSRDEENPLTVEDVKVAVNDYVKKYGMPATQEDGPKIFVEALGAPPAGEAYWKMSLLPDDQDKLRKVIDTWKKAVELNPLKRTAV